MIQAKLFEIGHCYSMYFQVFNSTIEFNIVDHLENGYQKAKICCTDKEFVFSAIALLERDVSQLKEIKCGRCEKLLRQNTLLVQDNFIKA